MMRTTITLERMASALDRHPLTTEQRARIFAALDNPGDPEKWQAVRHVALRPPARSGAAAFTLWRAVVAKHGSWYASPTCIPSTLSILEALEAA